MAVDFPLPDYTEIVGEEYVGEPQRHQPRQAKYLTGLMFSWSTRPDSNWRLAYGQYSPLANRSRLPLPLAMLLIERVQSQNQPKAPGTKKPAPLCGTGSFVWSTRPDSNWRPSRWQVIPEIFQMPEFVKVLLILGPALLGNGVR